MNHLHKKRLTTICIISLMVTIAVGLILYALKQNINVFSTPTDIVRHLPNTGYRIRLGGLVKKNSIKHDQQGLGVSFIVTDMNNELSVRYVGVLPDLFREEKGVVAEGELQANGTFLATQVLAKHDENYTPVKVQQAIKGATT